MTVSRQPVITHYVSDMLSVPVRACCGVVVVSVVKWFWCDCQCQHYNYDGSNTDQCCCLQLLYPHVNDQSGAVYLLTLFQSGHVLV